MFGDVYMPVVVRWFRPVPHSQHVKHSSLWFGGPRRLVVSPLAPLLEMGHTQDFPPVEPTFVSHLWASR